MTDHLVGPVPYRHYPSAGSGVVHFRHGARLQCYSYDYGETYAYKHVPALACRADVVWGRPKAWSEDPSEVTCGKCRRTRAFRAAKEDTIA